MAKRTVCIQLPATLTVRHKSLIVESVKGRAAIPLEDIWVVIIESHEAKLGSDVLAAMCDAGIVVMACGRNHHPNGLLLPFGLHSRHPAVIDAQFALSKPVAKQLWKRIVVAKISNQARVLELLDLGGAERLWKLATEVKSGDTDGREATAAQVYFKRLIPDGTRRKSSMTACLDYGYAVMRAGIAREAVAGGWLVSRGIHHHSETNSFNLVDDLIEPFRPVVDLLAAEKTVRYGLDTFSKHILAEVFAYHVVIDGKRYTAQGAISLMLDSFKQAVLAGDPTRLLLPEVIGLTMCQEADR